MYHVESWLMHLIPLSFQLLRAYIADDIAAASGRKWPKISRHPEYLPDSRAAPTEDSR